MSATANNPKPTEAQKTTLRLRGMSCANCAQAVERALQKTPGVIQAQVNFAMEKAYVEYKTAESSESALLDAVKKAGYDGSVDSPPARSGQTDDAQSQTTVDEEDADEQKVAHAARKMWLATAFAVPIMILMAIHMFITTIPGYFAMVAVLAFVPVVVVGWDTHMASYRAVRNLSPNMDTLVTLGSIIPYSLNIVGFWLPIGSFFEMAASIMTLHMVGRFLEAKAKGRASQAIKRLLAMGAKTARIIVDGEEQEVAIDQLRLDDVMVIRPGEKVPTDGVVIEGESTVDESMATGESLPVKREIDDPVIGATINGHGLLKVRATKVGKDTFLSQVIRMVEEAQGSKVPIQEFADRVTGWFVPAVLLVAAAAFVLWMRFPDFFTSVVVFFNLPWSTIDMPLLSLSLLATIAVLVISCPCALGLATPTAIMVGSGKGAENGILIRRGEAIQTIMNAQVIAFDKTGTITKGKPEVTDIVVLHGFDETEALYFAGALERASEHPLGQAIVNRAFARKIVLPKVTDFRSWTGQGVQGTIDGRVVRIGNRRLMEAAGIGFQSYSADMQRLENEAKTAMLVAVDDSIAAIIAVADTLKDDSALAIAELERMGISTVMVTGDNERTAQAIARSVGIRRVLSEVLPGGKVEEIKRLQAEHGTVVMVGDGINDAPALKQANVGIAIGTGTDIAIEAADITLVRGDLSAVISAIKLSRATFAKIKQNYFWAWFYNAIAIPAAFLGLIHPMIGAAAMAASSINVVLNSTRLRKTNIEPSYKA